MRRLISATMLLVSSAAMLIACSSFGLTNVWRSPDFDGPPMRNVLVIGISDSDATRRIFEDGLAQALAASGVKATSSYGVLPENGKIADERLKAAVTRTRADSVLITRLLRVEQKTDIVQPVAPPFGGYPRAGFYGWYGSAWSGVPTNVVAYNVLTLETTLWDMRKETAIWSGVTETIQPSDVSKATAAMAKVLIEQMKKDGVI